MRKSWPRLRVTGDEGGVEGCEARAGRYRVCERAWDLDADRRRHRDPGAQEIVWGTDEASSGEFEEVDDRAFAWWCGRFRGGHQRAGTTRSDLAPDDQSRSARSGVRSRLRSKYGAQSVGGLRAIELVRVWRYECRAHFQPVDWQIADQRPCAWRWPPCPRASAAAPCPSRAGICAPDS